jgi:hypothetical protein
VSAAVSSRCPEPQGRFPRVTHPCAAQGRNPALDLHVLGAPPAFVLSQDQTLSFIPAPAGKKTWPRPPENPVARATDAATSHTDATDDSHAAACTSPHNNQR